MVHANSVFLFLNISSCLLSLLYRRCYIRFIRKINEKKGIEGQEETKKAFEFMLNYVGKLFHCVLFVFYVVFEWIGVALVERMMKTHPRWFGHVRRRPIVQ